MTTATTTDLAMANAVVWSTVVGLTVALSVLVTVLYMARSRLKNFVTRILTKNKEKS